MLFRTFALIYFVCFLLNNNVYTNNVIEKKCNEAKLVPGKEFDAVHEVLEIVRTQAFPDIQSATIGGHKVWAQGRCLVAGDCKPCLNRLLDEVWSICDNSRGGEIEFKECSIRFEFYEF